ncbi:MAG TPA: YciI family protein [Actinomycetota bacterium]|nr:YciI family protein [Actinomycetota bacterium]
MLLIYGDEKAAAQQRESLSEEDQQKYMQTWFDYTDWLGQKGWLVAGDALLDTSQATSVRVQGGDRVVTDGPFAETKEQLGGYYLLDVQNVDDAIEAAAQCPGAQYGTIELRPLMEFDQAPS